MVLPERESRPAGGTTEPASISTAIKTGSTVAVPADTVRCTRCHRPLRAARSVELEVGPVCAHLMVEGVAA